MSKQQAILGGQFRIKTLLLTIAFFAALIALCVPLCSESVPSAADRNYGIVWTYAYAAEKYVVSTGNFPRQIGEIRKFYRAPSHLLGSDGKPPKYANDYWGRKMVFSVENDCLRIGSYGKDGKPKGEGVDKDVFVLVCKNETGQVWTQDAEQDN